MFKGNMPAYAWRAVAMCMVFFLLGSGVGGATVAYVQKQAAPQIEKREGMFGEYITFGSYEQDNTLENGAEPIEWRVLKKEDGKALVISVDALKLMQYHNTIAEDSSVAWETWDVRAWLNGEFLETAFTEEERLRIPTVTVWAEYGPQSKAEPGNDTQDKVFLLSFEEADEYLPGNSARQCKPTTYAIAEYEAANGKAWETNEPWYTDAVEGNCSWWLRTPGMFDGSATNVLRNGSLASFTRITLNNVGTSDFNYGVRPAIWIDLEP